MSDASANANFRALDAAAETSEQPRRSPVALAYLAALVMVGAATLLAFVAEHLITAPALTLIFVLPVVVAASGFGWGPSLTAVVAGVLAFDFFFTEPRYSLEIDSPADIWTAALLLIVGAIVNVVAGHARRQAMEARRAAEQAQALRGLAHAIIGMRPEPEVLQASATALNRIFRAPAVIFLETGADLRPVATAGSPSISAAEIEAARGALAARLSTRGETYPFDRAEFDFWPVQTASGRRCVIGLDFAGGGRERPAAPERFVEVVGAYLAAALGRAP